MNFPSQHCSEVRVVKDLKYCSFCGEVFFKYRGSERTCCPKHREPPKRLVERDLSKHWTEMTTFHLRSVQ